ncbi:MAG: NAD-dependent protein deacylase [Clostridia bacterium]|nr:NAD-dependent protein deacylase [Clostridia bacterium]
MDEIELLRNIIEESESIVFFGGAGVSTESGIPDFRGASGLYNEEQDDGMSPEEKLHINYLLSNPQGFFRYYKGNMMCTWAEPNDAHMVLSELEREGKLTLVVTQNIDGLHQKAGSVNVAELHGSIYRNYCVDCGKRYSIDHIVDSDSVPRCTECGGIVRPDVVLYGEPLSADVWYRAEESICTCDTLIVAGTSLTVAPASTLIDCFSGNHLVIINQTPTDRDDEAELVIRGSVGEVLRKAKS